MALPDASQSDAPMLIHPDKIRKIWHDGEWFYSVVDVIAELLDQDYEQARNYWKVLRHRLAKEGNETVTQCNRLKLQAVDGKMRLTDVVNTEQALRLIQSIPSPKAEPMKLWLAGVGAERLEETEDPELGLYRSLDNAAQKYRSEGRSNSWIEARVTGIVTRKQFVDALKAAVMDATARMYADATERLYKGLWDRTTAQLRGELHLTLKQNPRDHFGKYALIYTRLAEELAADKLGEAETVLLYQAMEIIWEVAKLISQQARATSALLNMDLVTERPLLTGG
jgi:BRO family, N-terminal domain